MLEVGDRAGRGRVPGKRVDGLIDRVEAERQTDARPRARERALKIRIGRELGLAERLRLGDESLGR